MSTGADIVVVNWNSGDNLRSCVASIADFGGAALRKTIIVDNASNDGSVDLGETSAQTIRAARNLGFSSGCNLGARYCTADYVLFLNPDARLMPNTLDVAISFMDSAEASAVGICGVKLIGDTGQIHRHCAKYPVWRGFLGRILGLGGVLPAVFPPQFMVEFDHLASRAVDQVIGAFFLVRRNVFEQLGGFDERFFVYLEDVDFSKRAKAAGWTSWYLAEAVAFHKGGGSSENIKARRLYYSIQSRLLYAEKHFSRAQTVAILAATLLIEPLARLGRAALHGSWREALYTVQAFAMLWRGLPSMFCAKSQQAKS